VLIVVTIIVMMLSLAGLSFMTMMTTEHKAVDVHGDEMKLSAMIGSGEELLCVFLSHSPNERSQLGGLVDNPTLFRGVLVCDDQRYKRHGRCSVIAPKIENGQVTGMHFGAENESARLNLNVLLDWEKDHPGCARAAMINLPGMTDEVADSILDWMDEDSEAREFGAEAEYYKGLGVPYVPRNAAPSSLEELLLVKGVTRDLLFGADANFNYQLDPDESVAVSATASADVSTGMSSPSAATSGEASGSFVGSTQLAWASLLTVTSAERNVNGRGKPRIDLNEKSLKKLHQKLARSFDRRWADFVVFYRQFGPSGEADPDSLPGWGEGGGSHAQSPWKTGSEVSESAAAMKDSSVRNPRTRMSKGPDFGEPGRPNLSLPAKFELDSVLDLVGVVVTIPGSDDREPQTVDCPFPNRPSEMARYLPALLDVATVERSSVIHGRVNVDLAPRTVLLGVPGLDGAVVEQIVAARGTSTGSAAGSAMSGGLSSGEFSSAGLSLGNRSGSSPRHAAWLLAEGVVDLATMKALEPYLTTGGDVYRAQVVGFFDEGGPAGRVELIVDATTETPRRVYWKDLRMLGRGYPLEALGAVPPEQHETYD